MSSSTSKKVIVERFDRSSLPGFVSPRTYLHADGVELLSPNGTVTLVPYAEIRAVRFVREFPSADAPAPKRKFGSRPKMPGLWVRLRFQDDQEWEGVLPNNLVLGQPFGFDLAPPDVHGDEQRLFVPRAGVVEASVLSVISPPVRRVKTGRPTPKGQLEMFAPEKPESEAAGAD